MVGVECSEEGRIAVEMSKRLVSSLFVDLMRSQMESGGGQLQYRGGG
jgi:hypothetical protein